MDAAIWDIPIKMISKKQLTANRRNARKSTGPKTAGGKAIVSQNALRHGLLSELRVLPGLERQEDWQAHIERTLADLNPVGYMEEILAERIALLLWRLGRVARYERGTAAAAFENAENDLAMNDLRWRSEKCRTHSPLKEAKEKTEFARRWLTSLESCNNLPKEEPVPNGASVISAAASAAYTQLSDLDVLPPGLSDYPDGFDPEDVSWTADLVCQTVQAIANFKKLDFDELMARMTRNPRRELAEAESEEDAVVRRLEQYRRASILPGEAHLEKVHRYEAHLERAFYKAMHEFQRLQAARRYGAPAPVAIDVIVDGEVAKGVDDHD